MFPQFLPTDIYSFWGKYCMLQKPSIFPFPTKKKSSPRRKLVCIGNQESSEETQDSDPETEFTGSTYEWNVHKSVEPVLSESLK